MSCSVEIVLSPPPFFQNYQMSWRGANRGEVLLAMKYLSALVLALSDMIDSDRGYREWSSNKGGPSVPPGS